MMILNGMEDCQWRSVGAPSAPRSVGVPPLRRASNALLEGEMANGSWPSAARADLLTQPTNGGVDS